MALHELHPFSDWEIAQVPQKRGVYILFQVESPIHADGAENLRKGIVGAKEKFPRATHFAVETLSSNARAFSQRVRKLKKEMKLVRIRAFLGSAR
jgi:hypothetical protein